MEEYIKVKDLIDMLEQRLVFQEQHGFYRDAGYTSRFIESIADIPREDVVAKSEYDRLAGKGIACLYPHCLMIEKAEVETAKKIFADIEFGANTNYQTPVGTFVTMHTGIYDALKKKYTKEN